MPKTEYLGISFDSELEVILDETPLSDAQRKGAKMYYIKHVHQNIIAQHFNYSKSAIDYQKRKISKACRETCCRMFK